MERKNLGEMLLTANLIDQVQMQIALAEQQRTGRRFGSTLVDLKFIDENVLAAFLSKQTDIPCISLLHIDIPKKVLRRMDRQSCLDLRAIPVRMDDRGRLEVAMVDPSDSEMVAKLEELTKESVRPLIAPESSISAMIDRFYPKDVAPDETLTVRRPAVRNAPADPVFWDLIEELETSDLPERLTKIEQRLDHIWVLLEKVLRALEASDTAPRGR
ncbi:MAG TPA: hypothetical protein VFL80_13045 [Thermoanaerobaculia bacterium]|nr:hypothetical protein [Thermoanaerobaculia bacterium]